jgi:hypothetical protein
MGAFSPQSFLLQIKYAQHFGSDAVCRAILLKNLGEPNHDMNTVLQQHDATLAPRDVLSHAQTVLQLLYTLQDDKVTMPMLVKEWREKTEKAHEWYVRGVLLQSPEWKTAVSHS